MRRWSLRCLLLVLLVAPLKAEDTVGEDIGDHQLERLVELLTPEECEDLLHALSRPEDNVFQRLRRLSPENNQLRHGRRAKRSAATAAAPAPATTTTTTIGSEEECRAALEDWLRTHGREIYDDRLTRALQHIGRMDVAIEVGKNINQDKSVRLQRYLKELLRHSATLKIPPIPPPDDRKKIRRREVKDVTLQDLGLIVERVPPPPWQQQQQQQRRGGRDLALPLLYGLLLALGGNLLLILLTLALMVGWRRR